jgi:hypothetical protein
MYVKGYRHGGPLMSRVVLNPNCDRNIRIQLVSFAFLFVYMLALSAPETPDVPPFPSLVD